MREPGCYFALDVGTGKGHLFVPRLPEEYEVWMGKLLSCNQFKNIYGVDEVHYVDEVNTHNNMILLVVLKFYLKDDS